MSGRTPLGLPEVPDWVVEGYRDFTIDPKIPQDLDQVGAKVNLRIPNTLLAIIDENVREEITRTDPVLDVYLAMVLLSYDPNGHDPSVKKEAEEFLVESLDILVRCGLSTSIKPLTLAETFARFYSDENAYSGALEQMSIDNPGFYNSLQQRSMFFNVEHTPQLMRDHAILYTMLVEAVKSPHRVEQGLPGVSVGR